MILYRWSVLFGLLGVVLAPMALALPAATLTLPVEALHPGQKAVVRTVFQGEKIEEFDAEIVGVLHQGRAGGDMILARATSERVIKSGVAMGMSGSPVYVDGKLIGALSSGWPFSREPVFGVTPIGEMLEVLQNPTAGGDAGAVGPSGVDANGTSAGVSFGEFRWSDDDPSALPDLPARLAAPPAASPSATRTLTPTPLAIPLACGGLDPRTFEFARDWLAPFGLAAVPGGQAKRAVASSAPVKIEPGSAVAIDLLRGDLQFSAIGTVTWCDGDRVLIFGHPFFQSGEVRLPLATAEITTVIASDLFSFKMGVRGQDAGVVTQDRRAAVAGQLGGTARMMPVAVDVAQPGRPLQRFRFESIEDRALAPTLISLAAVNSVLESGGTAGNLTLEWTLSLYRSGAAPLILNDVMAGESPTSELGSSLMSPLRFLYNNPYARLPLDSVKVDVRITPGREQWTLRSARLLDAAVRPGGKIRIEAELERWRGGREMRELTVRVPEEVPEGRFQLLVGSGPELNRFEAAHLPGRYRPTSLEDAWNRLGELRTSDGLHAALYAPAPEVTSEGRDYPELPLSAVALLASGQRVGDPVRRGDVARLDETRIPLTGVVRGALSLSVSVENKAP